MNNLSADTISSDSLNELYIDALTLLKELIATPSLSREEHQTADILENFLRDKKVEPKRFLNNVWAKGKHFKNNKPTLLLNSHHDTVKANPGYTLNPFDPIERKGQLFGLGSNDAGGCLVSLLSTFLYFSEKDLPFNVIFAASAEEEISGKNGMEALIPELPKVDFAIVGEPTKLQMAIAEKGLMVLDCVSTGKAGHAARDEGINALYLAMDDIQWFRDFKFSKVSEFLGPVHMAVTSIETINKAHNMVPETCSFVVDVRVNELYSFEEILETVRGNVKCTVSPRSLRLKPSGISPDHPLVLAGTA
ncbi:MAG: M20/M25/M40 family metallo-hydrolase, partial [Ginsengibacter sp.]